METPSIYERKGIFFVSGTDPTYKEWKLSEISHRTGYPIEHGSYLQGMETQVMVTFLHRYVYRTDPTYKEWKLFIFEKEYPFV